MDIQLETVHEYCANCGCLMIMPKNVQDSLRASKQSFYCLNGHAQSYTKSTAQVLKEEKDRLERKIATLQTECYEAKQEIYDLKHAPKRRAKRIKDETI